MLPPVNRMRRSTDFTSVVRAGARSRSGTLVVHHRPEVATGAPLVGLVVARSVGGSVVRHRVSRRLRAQLTERLPALPPGSGTVVRALAPAATASSGQLGRDLDRAFASLSGAGSRTASHHHVSAPQ